jgi:hypothetical protein
LVVVKTHCRKGEPKVLQCVNFRQANEEIGIEKMVERILYAESPQIFSDAWKDAIDAQIFERWHQSDVSGYFDV